MDKDWIERRTEKLKEGIASHQQNVQQKTAEIAGHNKRIQSNLGALAILDEQLVEIDASASDNNAT